MEKLKIIFEQQISDLNTKLGKLERELANEKSKFSKVNGEKAKLDSQIKEITKEKNLSKEKISKLESELNEFISLQIKHENEFKEIKESLNKSKNNEQNLKSTNQVVLLTQLQKTLETKLDEAEKNVISINENLVNSFKLEIEKLQLKANNAEKEKKKLDKDLKEAIKKIAELDNINFKLIEEKNQLENSLKTLRNNN